MLRFKHFIGRGDQLEQEVNSWLAQYEPDVSHMTQSAAGDGNVSISFLFEESFRGQERRLDQEKHVQTIPVAVPEESIPVEPIVVPTPAVPPANPV